MSLVAVSVAVALTALSLWGLLHPRSFWRVLMSWSVSDTHRVEPGGASYRVRRILAGFSLLAVIAILAAVAIPKLIPLREVPAPGEMEAMWGSPAPRLVDRVVNGTSIVPEGLVQAEVVGYQVIDEDGPPEYLIDVPRYSRLGEAVPPGLVGNDPGEGFTAAGSAELLIRVLGPLLCIPRSVVVEETETAVRVAVYFGLPDGSPPPAADEPQTTAPCDQNPDVAESLLMPIELVSQLGDRAVETIEGIAVPRVREID